MKPVDILLVEDQVLLRRGLKRLLEAAPDLRVAAEAGCAEEAVALLGQGEYDLLMTDLTLPDRDGLWLVRKVQQDHPALPVVVVSMHEDPRTVSAALEAGVRGYLLKTATPSQLLEAVGCAARGEVYVQPELAGQASIEVGLTPALSLADVDLLHFARRGLAADSIREHLSLSVPTFESRVRSICRKLQACDLEAAVQRALAESLLVSDDHGATSPRVPS